MKPRQWLCLLLFVLFLFPSTALANSLSFHYYQGGISGGMFSVSNQPISVLHETLSFSLPDEDRLSDATICAAYDHTNQGNNRENVSMLFPILFWSEDVKTLEGSLSVTVDTLSIPCRFALIRFSGGNASYYTEQIWESEVFLRNSQYEAILQSMERQGVTLDQFLSSGVSEQYEAREDDDPGSPWVLLVLYEVSFEPGQERHVEVSYQQRGMTPYNNTERAQDVEFYYLLNPAKAFAGFGTLDILIDAKAKGARLTADGFNFVRGKDGIYRTSLNGLPEQDLHFKLSRGDRNSSLYIAIGAFALFWLLVFGGGIVGIAVLISLRKKNRKQRGKSSPV